MLGLRFPPATVASSLVLTYTSRRLNGSSVRCALKGPRPRYPRVWKSRKRIGTISKAAKLIECIKGLSNVKEEVYVALDSFVTWELEFPLITVKKALKTLENEEEWRRVIQVTKWMLSKGQGKTKGSYYTLLNALAEDGRLEEAEELWTMIFSESWEHLPREFFCKMISIYYNRGMHEKMFEVLCRIIPHRLLLHLLFMVALMRSQQNPNGLVTRTQVYLATHGRKDGATGNQYLDEIDNLIQRDPTIVEKDLNHDPVALVRRDLPPQDARSCRLMHLTRKSTCIAYGRVRGLSTMDEE
ncbi:hypothetical protein MRB53_032901 [Persea americana]|uniref:Uncharacterized protein n=1 Tax=Persea americana TaxID=3435 RepID=A0ACC2KT19_PERAE|nr:hypothetical protein MRB53_032901 [Persea americana]